MATDTAIQSEIEILTRVIEPERMSFPADIAKEVLLWKFAESDLRRMTELAERHNEGALTPPEIEELERYHRVGMFLNLVQAKARLSLPPGATSAS